MAIFKPTIFQDISGSVGNVTSYKVGKTQIARGKPGFVKDAQTPEQLKQRARLSLITKLRRRFLKVLSVGYCSPSGKVCANCFTRDNIHKVNAEDAENPTVDLLTLALRWRVAPTPHRSESGQGKETGLVPMATTTINAFHG